MKAHNYLVTWMYSATVEQNIVHHQTGKSNRQTTQNLYWRCVFCMLKVAIEQQGSVSAYTLCE